VPLLAFSALLLHPKNKALLYFGFLAVLALFLSKGAASPGGTLFLWMFVRIPVLQVFRDPFEKIGILIPLAFAPLFGASISLIYRRGRGTLRKLFSKLPPPRGRILSILLPTTLIALICISTLGALVWPIWTGNVFMSTEPPKNNPQIGYSVSVPPFYREASNWLSNQTGDFRLIVLPIDGESMSYNWTYGYDGAELSNLLLNTRSISIAQNIPSADAISARLEKSLLRGDQFWKIMAMLNTKYVVVRSDIDYSSWVTKARGITPSDELTRALNVANRPNVIGGYVNGSDLVRGLNGLTNSTNLRIVWADSQHPSSLTESRNDTEQSARSIVLDAYPSLGPDGRFYMSISYSAPMSERSWGLPSYFDLWLKSNVSGLVWVGITDQLGNTLEWDGRIDSVYSIDANTVNSWKLFTFPTNSPSKRTGELRFDQVQSVGIVLIPFNGNLPVTLKVGGAFSDSGKETIVDRIHHEMSFGKLDFYSVDATSFLPVVYATSTFVSAADVDDMIFNVMPRNDFDPRTSIIFLRSQASVNNVNLLARLRNMSLNSPSISFLKLDPTRYVVHISNAVAPFFLTLSEAFHPGWRAYYGESNWLQSFDENSIPSQYHFIANGYSNSWYVNKTGTFTITLYFFPQSLLYAGTVISLSTFAALVVFPIRGMIISRTRTRKKWRVLRRARPTYSIEHRATIGGRTETSEDN
jgi:hypothetical protein